MNDVDRIYNQTKKMLEDNEVVKQMFQDNGWPFTDHSEALNKVLDLCIFEERTSF